MTASTRVDEFEELRPHLLAVAYRLTGTVADAEDIVQDAWLRWDGAAPGSIDDLGAWLTTVVSRLGLDRLRSAAHRRETYFGEWLPEPVVTGFDGNDPLAAVVAGEDARFAAMVVLERLTPDQRVAFVLHDGFAVPFGEIASVLGVSDATARQLASRARRAVASAPEPVADDHPQRGGRCIDGGARRWRHGCRCAPSASRRHVHRRLQPQGADGRSGHPRPGQGRAVLVRPGTPLRAELAVDEPAGARQRPARQLHRRCAPAATAIPR